MRRPERIRRAGRIDPKTGKRKPYLRWQVVVPLGEGKKRTLLFATKDEANAHCAQMDREKRRIGQTIDPNTTFADVLPEFRRSAFKQARPRSVRGYEVTLQRLSLRFGGCFLQAMSACDIEKYADEDLRKIQAREEVRVSKALASARRRLAWAQRQAKVDPASYERRVQELEARARTIDRHGCREINKSIQMLKRVLAWSQSHQYVGVNVAAGVMTHSVRPRIDRATDQTVYNAAEITALLAASEPGLAHAALSVLVYGGTRIGELRALSWGDFEPAAGRVWVHRGVDDVGEIGEPKTPDAHRFVALPSFLVKELKVWRLACPSGSLNLMFPNAEGGVMDDDNFRKRVYQRAQRRAGLRAIPLHNLRHTCASLLIAAGADLATVSKHMGHANLAITLGVYGHWFERRSDTGVAAKLEAFLEREKNGACVLTAISSATACGGR